MEQTVKWIPLEGQRPQVGQWVLAASDRGEVLEVIYRHDREKKSPWNEPYFEWRGQRAVWRFTHWMRLPLHPQRLTNVAK